MGRPLRKDVRGTDVIGTPASNTGITVQFYDGSSLITDGVIVKQRGANTFLVCARADLGVDTSKYYVCKLVNTTPNASGEMYMTGSTSGELDRNLIPIAKLTRRIAYGFPSSPDLSNGFWRSEDSNDSDNHDQTKYTWYLESDSSADYIVLTAISTTM